MMKLTMASSSIALTFLAVLCSHLFVPSDAYPIIVELPERKDVCLDLNIPDNDDVHLVMVAFPGTVDDKLEDWFVHEVAEMTRFDSVQFLKDLSNMPDDIKRIMKSQRVPNGRDAMVHSHIELATGEEDSKPLHYFKAVTLRNVATSMSEGKADDDWNPEYGEMSVCFKSQNKKKSKDNPDLVVFNYVVQSEYETKMKRKHEVKKEHLSPLEAKLEATIVTGREIISEMLHMQTREQRMKKTADSTNIRIKYFSYISISLLLGVTYLQITYLKGYFKKKKVL